MKQIELNVDGNKAFYNSKTRIVTHFTMSGVFIECYMPKDWALTRIFQFMDSLLKKSDEII